MRIGYEVAQQRPLGTDGENHSDLQVPQGKSSLESLSPREFSRNSLTGFTEPGFSRLLGKAILGLKAHQSCEPIPSRFTGPNVMCNRSDGGNGEVDAGVEDKDGGSAVYEQEEPLDFSSKGRQRHSEATLDLRTNGAASPTGSTPCPSLSSPKMPLFSAPSKDRPVETDLSTKEIVRSKIELRLAELRNSGYGAPNKGHPHPFGHNVSATSPPPPQPPPWANFRKGDDRERLLLLDKVRSPDRLDELGHVTRMVARARQTGQVPELLRLKNCLAGSERSLVDDDLPLGNGVNVINSFNMMAMNGFGSHHGQHLTNVPMSLLSPSSATTAAPSRQQTQLQPLVCSDGDNGLGSSSLKLNRPFKNYHSRDAALPLGYCGLSVPFLSAAATDDLLVSGQGLCATDSLGNGSYEEFKRQIRQLQQQQHHQLQHKRPSAAFNGVGHLPLSMSHLIHPRATLPQQHRFVQCEGGERRPDSGCLTTTVLLERRTAADRDAPASPLCRAAPNSSSSTLSSCSPPSPTAAALLNATSAVSALSGGVGGGLMEERPPSRSVAEHPCVSPPSSSSDSVAAMAVATNRANLSPVHPPQSADSNGSNHGNSNSSNGALHLAASKKRGRSLPDELKDEAYWERRRKNNEAAKRSRDARRAKEDEIAIRAAFLEQENLKLRVEVAALKSETAKLRCLLYNS